MKFLANLKGQVIVALVVLAFSGWGVKNVYDFVYDRGYNAMEKKCNKAKKDAEDAAKLAYDIAVDERQTLQERLDGVKSDLINAKQQAEPKTRVITHETIKYVNSHPDVAECVLPDEGVQLIRSMAKSANSGRDSRAPAPH